MAATARPSNRAADPLRCDRCKLEASIGKTFMTTAGDRSRGAPSRPCVVHDAILCLTGPEQILSGFSPGRALSVPNPPPLISVYSVGWRRLRTIGNAGGTTLDTSTSRAVKSRHCLRGLSGTQRIGSSPEIRDLFLSNEPRNEIRHN